MMYFLIFWEGKFLYYKISFFPSIQNKLEIIILKHNINQYLKRNNFSEKYVLEITQCSDGEL